jgi:hypothetical protein
MSLVKVKAVLTLLMAVGAVAYFGGDGTLASFSAETTNAGSTIASGTLTMSNTVSTNNACFSNQAATHDNINAGCDKLFQLANVAPGLYGGTAQVAVQNTGTIDASKLWLWAPSVTPSLTVALTSGNAVTTLSVSPLKSAVVAGQAVVLTNGVHTQTFYASAAAAASATSISVTSQNANFSYTADANTLVDVADCYDVATTGGTNTSTAGNNLNFISTAGNPFCHALLLYVQEITGTVAGTPGTHNYCWVGLAYTGNAMCVAPISVTLSSALTSGNAVGSLPVTALNGNVKSGDQIVVSSGNSTQTFSASADAYIGATSITVTSATANATYAIGSSVADSPTDPTGPLSRLDSDSTDTLANFDSLHDGARGPIQLPPVLSNGSIGATTLTQLTHGSTRTFLVGVMLPAPTGSAQNTLQGLQSTFGLTWHIDQ